MRIGVDTTREAGGLNVTLGGVSILDLDERLTLTEAQEVPKTELRTSERASPHGQFPACLTRQRLEIRLTVHLKVWDAAARADVYEKLWAFLAPGLLTVSWRPGQALQVDAGEVESLSALSAWTKTLTVKLYAVMQPFFRDISPTPLTLTGRDAAETFTPPGLAGAVVDFEITNLQTADLTEALIETFCEGERLSFFSFTGLLLPAGSALSAAHEETTGLLSLQASGVSCMNSRSRLSSDDLKLLPLRENTLHIYANRRVQADVRLTGLYP